MTRSVRVLTLSTLIGLSLPCLARAQQVEQRAMYELPALTVVVSRDTPLSEQALGLFTAGKWREAAEVYRNAASGMTVNSVEAYEAYDMAARLYFYGRDYGSSRDMMERAASIAEETGDIVSAAYRHVDAAFIAVWEGYPGSRREHIKMAEEYAASEDFGAEHAAKISALIHGVSALPMKDGEG